MSVWKSRPALRWLVPGATAVVVIGGGAAAGTIVASADPSLPDRSAAQLLVDLQSADPAGLSGTVVQSADLGLPGIAGLASSLGGAAGGSGGLTSLISGSNTARVWYAGEDKVRLALQGTQGETDVIRNGSDVWQWSSSDNTGTHLKLRTGTGPAPRHSLPSAVPSTPQQAADAALAAIDPTTKVETTGAAQVAGRDAYELVLSPKDTESLVGQVRLAIDAEQHIPLRVEVYAKNAVKPAIRVAFDAISFDMPDAEQFTFNPPPGAKIEEAGTPSADSVKKGGSHSPAVPPKKGGAAAAGEPKVIGKGWTSILSAKLPSGDFSKELSDAGKGTGEEAKTAQALMGVLPEVSGSWGKGRLLSGSLFSVLITDDGRVLAGLVTPEALYKVA
ncbi:LolA family protein [Actinoplanes siamensis]|uniref:LolA family protein n=1 Tax=Actinoplanes siamensis TaxID=1223317 RepID=UPI001943F6AD|nr:sigma-E factor regulatory protein RseB domain-containing protein [Actinoplanes siamensis]